MQSIHAAKTDFFELLFSSGRLLSHIALEQLCVAGAAKTKVMQFIKLYRLLTFLLNGLNEKEKIFQALSIIIVISIKCEQCAASVAILSVYL